MQWRKMKVAYDGNVFVWPLYLFNSWLLPLGFKVSSFRIQKFSLSFNKFFMVSLLKVLLRICSIMIKLASLLNIWSFIAKWRKAGIASALYIFLRWLFSLKWKSVSALPTYCMWHLLHFSLTYIFYVTLLTFWKVDDKIAFAVNLVKNCKYPSILLATKWMCVLHL